MGRRGDLRSGRWAGQETGPQQARGGGGGLPVPGEQAMRWLSCGIVLTTWAWLAACELLAGPSDNGDKPASRPPWQRLLGKADQQQADLLNKEIAAAVQDQKWDVAIQAATKLAALRDKVQGADHWQAVNAHSQLRTLRRVAGLKPDEQQ